MKIKSELLSIQRYPNMPDGTPVEPEQQPAARLVESEASANLRSGETVGKIPVRFIFETTAGEAAKQVRQMCRGCKHFRRKRWQRYLEEYDSTTAPIEKRMIINEIRFQLQTQTSEEMINMHTATAADGTPDFDVEHALNSLGVCDVLSELAKDEIVQHPLCQCPAELASGIKVKTPERPSGYYEPKSLEAERKANAEYDSIMNTAAGKK